MEKTNDSQMKIIWDHYGNDISAFIGGFSFTTAFAGELFGSIAHIMAVGLFGGIMGVVGKEIGGYIVNKVKSMFK